MTPFLPALRTTSRDQVGEDARREALFQEVKEYFPTGAVFTTDGLAGPDDRDPVCERFIDDRWFDFRTLEGRAVVERTWLNRPYTYLPVLYNPASRTHRYDATAPDHDNFERYVRDDLVPIRRNSLRAEDFDEEEHREVVFPDKAASVVAEHAATVMAGVSRNWSTTRCGTSSGSGRATR